VKNSFRRWLAPTQGLRTESMARVILSSYPKTTMRYILRRAEELATKAYQYNALPIHGLEALSPTEWRRSYFLCLMLLPNIRIIQTTT
jgi:hypothetical protein